MYFLRLSRLKEHLIRDGLTERERYLYLVAQALLALWAGGAENATSSLARGVVAVITLAGLYYAYRLNGGAAGRGILDRFISVSLVVNIRVLLVLLVVAGILHASIFEGAVESLDDSLSGYFALFGAGGSSGLWDLVLLVAEGWVAWSVARHVGDVHRLADGGMPVPATASGTALAPAAAPHRTTAAELDRFVETVTQRELAGQAVDRRGPADRRRQAQRRAVAGRIRLIRAKRRR